MQLVTACLLPALRRRRLEQLTDPELVATELVVSLATKLTYGDWLVLTRLAGALSPDVASLLVETVAKQLPARGNKLGGRRRKELEIFGPNKGYRKVGGRLNHIKSV